MDLSFMCVLSIKVPIWKKSGNLFNDPRKYGRLGWLKIKKKKKDEWPSENFVDDKNLIKCVGINK